MLNRVFQGFTALPEASDEQPWWVVLGLDAIEKVYKALAREHHPDVPGGDEETMVRLNGAIAEARAEKGQNHV